MKNVLVALEGLLGNTVPVILDAIDTSLICFLWFSLASSTQL